VAVACLAGCSARLSDLDGPRSVTAWIPAEAGDRAAELPAEFVLRNRSLGSVRVESLRVPISTVVETDPRLPATIPPGRELRVRVTGKFRPAEGNRVRTVLLETAGDAPLELSLDGRVRPMPPADSATPQPIAPK
jgi:hypothetical protein